MRLYTISGIDGSGKTTQMEMLQKHLQENGYDVTVFHATSFSIATKIRNFFENSKNNDVPRKAKTSAGFLSILLRKIFLVIDILRFNSYVKKMPPGEEHIVLTDRYFFDQIVNIFYLENKLDVSYIPVWLQLAEMFIATPQKSFYIRTKPSIAMNRERDIEQGSSYLTKKSLLYDLLSDRFKYIRIDGNLEKEKVFEELLNLI